MNFNRTWKYINTLWLCISILYSCVLLITDTRLCLIICSPLNTEFSLTGMAWLYLNRVTPLSVCMHTTYIYSVLIAKSTDLLCCAYVCVDTLKLTSLCRERAWVTEHESTYLGPLHVVAASHSQRGDLSHKSHLHKTGKSF